MVNSRTRTSPQSKSKNKMEQATTRLATQAKRQREYVAPETDPKKQRVLNGEITPMDEREENYEGAIVQTVDYKEFKLRTITVEQNGNASRSEIYETLVSKGVNITDKFRDLRP